MGEITSRNRNENRLEGLPEGARVLERTARPLTGLEVKEALRRHLLELGQGLAQPLGPEADPLMHRFENEVLRKLDAQAELCKLNLVYPGVGWRVEVVLEELETPEEGLQRWLQALVELDLEPGKRKELQVGLAGRGLEVSKVEDEQLQSRVPDKVREQRGLPVEVDWVKGPERGKAELKPARSVEIGGGAPDSPKLPVIEKAEMPIEDLIGELPKEVGKVAGKGVEVEGRGTRMSYTTAKAKKGGKGNVQK